MPYKRTMKSPRPQPLLHLLFTTAILHLHPFSIVALLDAATSPCTAPSPATTDNNYTEFIRTSCQTTRYPELCYTSLSGYANAVRNDPAKLAIVAIGVCLSRVNYTAIYFNNITRQANHQTEPRAVAALHDCCSVFGDAVDEIRMSLTEMKSVETGGAGGESFRFQMSNVQTWLSAALTNEETCRDGFEDVPEGTMKMDVSDHVNKVEEVTSNALALVNGYVAKAKASLS